ncbi:hypothetical protein OUZ56_010096 [Daphnia magna]|uniref:Uncharacterized protein n=1 Tax=Daphnia magna TaxID=35525 RepID=A0ABR0AHS5_9CRUS|nr:hypothetical protein OUZ56_010096 [Daphnia magna]
MSTEKPSSVKLAFQASLNASSEFSGSRRFVIGGKDFLVALPLHVLNHTVLTAKYSHDSGAGRKEQRSRIRLLERGRRENVDCWALRGVSHLLISGGRLLVDCCVDEVDSLGEAGRFRWFTFGCVFVDSVDEAGRFDDLAQVFC